MARHTQWLPGYLIDFGVIVYLSPYGSLTNPVVIPLWGDIAVTAVFSLAIYWTLAVAPATEQIQP